MQLVLIVRLHLGVESAHIAAAIKGELSLLVMDELFLESLAFGRVGQHLSLAGSLHQGKQVCRLVHGSSHSEKAVVLQNDSHIVTQGLSDLVALLIAQNNSTEGAVDRVSLVKVQTSWLIISNSLPNAE